MFIIEGKVALITGGASGIGFEFAKELLRNNLKGVVIADIDVINGHEAVKELQQEFGQKKAFFIQTDIVKKENFEEAFTTCIKQFQHIDILINNAGIFDDSMWEKEITINVNGTINGILLAIDKYIKNFKSGSEGVILNVSSICGIEGWSFLPIYCATKFSIIGMTKSWGTKEHYERTGVKVLALCPGLTNTNIIQNLEGHFLSEEYEKMNIISCVSSQKIQSTKQCGEAMIKVLKNAANGTVWVSEYGKEPYEFIFPNRKTIKKNQ